LSKEKQTVLTDDVNVDPVMLINYRSLRGPAGEHSANINKGQTVIMFMSSESASK